MDLIKQIAKPLVKAAFEYVQDEENMEAIWDWAEDKASSTDTGWDDVAVASVKAVFPSFIEIAEGPVDSWLEE